MSDPCCCEAVNEFEIATFTPVPKFRMGQGWKTAFIFPMLPFVLTGDTGLVGFKEEDWKKAL